MDKIKVLSFNIPLGTILSYSRFHDRLIDCTRELDWYYGGYGYNGPVIKTDRVTHVPCLWDDRNGPANLIDLIRTIKPDVLMMHDDVQRIGWIDRCPIPVVNWLPWDNEDQSHMDSYQIINKSDVVATIAKFAQYHLISKGFQNVFQIYDPLDTKMYYKDENAGKGFKSQLGIPEDDKIITFVGRPGWRKRITHVIEIARRIRKTMPNVHLLLHTDLNDPSLGIRLEENLYAANMLNNDACFHPANYNYLYGVEEEKMRAIYNATDVYITPHGGEGLGMPIVESMACEKPFVATDFSTTQEFAGYALRGGEMVGERGIGIKIGWMFNDRGIQRPYADLDEFVEKTLYLLNNPDVCKEMGKKGREYVVKELDCEVVGKKFIDLCKHACRINMVV